MEPATTEEETTTVT